MSEFGSVEAALWAFKKRDRSLVLTKATLAYLILSLTLNLIYFSALWPVLGELFSWYLGALRDMARGVGISPPDTSLLIQAAPVVLAAGFASLVLFAAYEAACLRWLTRAESGGGFWGVQLNTDTWRTLLTYLVWIGLGVAFALLGAASFVGLMLLGQLAGAARIVALFVGALTPLALFAMLIWVATRLGPAAASSVARRKFAFFEAWRATQAIFWNLMGAYVIVLAAYMAVGTLIAQLARAPMNQAMTPVIVTIAGGGDITAGIEEIWRVLATPAFMALGIGYLVVATIIACVFRVAMFGVNARVMVAALDVQGA